MKIPDHSIQTQFRCVRRRFKGRYLRSVGPVEATALLNVILLLFMMHMFTSSYVLQPGIRLALPPAPFEDGVPYGSLILTITQEGMLFFDDERVDWQTLPAAFAKTIHPSRGDTLLVEADEGTPYQSLVRIYTLARDAGIRDVALATRPPPLASP